MATFTERLELLITSTAKDAVSGLKQTSTAADELTTKQKLLGAGQSAVNSQLGKFGISAEAAGGALKAAAVGAGALAAVKIGEFALDSANQFADLAGQVRNFQRASGASAEDSSRWVAALDDLQVSADKGGTAAFKLGREIASGGDKLAAFGIEIAKNKDGTADLTGTMLNVADAYKATNDPAERAAIALQIFGKAGKDLVPVLEQGREGLKKFFEGADTGRQIFTQDQLDQARAYELALDNLSDTMRGLKLAVGGAVAPAITQIANTIANTITTFDQATSSVGGLGGVLKAGWDFTPLANAIHGVSAGADLLQGNFADAGAEFVKSLPVVGGIASAFGLGGEAAETFSSKQNNLKEATQHVLDLQVQGKQGTQEYRDAVHEATSASDAFKQSTDAVGQSLQSTAEKEFAAQQQHLAYALSGVSLQQAALGVAGALDDEAKAQKDADDAAQFGIDKSRDVQAAHLKTEQAIGGVITAAQARAVQALGPQATSEEKARAATQATADAITFLAATTPGATQAIADLGYKVVTLPDGKQIVVDVPTGKPIADLDTIGRKADDVARTRELQLYIKATSESGVLPGYEMGGIVPGRRGVPQLAVVHGGEHITPAGRAVPASAAGVAPVVNITVNVTTGGLGADAPEIQRAVVHALRGYVNRNGALPELVGA